MTFLTNASSTLESLIIGDSAIPRSQDEGYALDLSIPLMERLSNLRVNGDLLSFSSLTRKKRNGSTSSIYISDTTLNQEGFEEALEKTGWARIDLRCRAWASDETFKGKAFRVAESQGISLTIENYYP